MTADLLARRAALLADRTRTTMCLALLDGRAWTNGELAREAGVAASTASEHISALHKGGLLTEVRQGRHRYVRLIPELGDVLEELAVKPGRPVGLRDVHAANRLDAARTCYDHLAGGLGVAIYQTLFSHGLLDDAGLTDAGRAWFERLLGADSLSAQRRPLVRSCLDWTRRVPHLGGALGGRLASHMFEQGWVERRARREVMVTRSGQDALITVLGVPGDVAAAFPVPV